MKTLVVLSALAAVALAAPTLVEQGLENFKKLTYIPHTFKRERKSLLESSNSDPITGESANLPSTSHVTEFGVSGRSFGLKKPIIIKKKPVGYQVYRDSDEVPSESGETCGSQVKVKFCDGKTKLKSSTIEDTTQITEEDMKHSITLAKEAIENLQKDLNTVEGKPVIQGSSWNHGHSETDAELHQDIENAREALEHIHNNFGKLESMSLHAAPIPEVPFTIAHSEEQRLAQWKEAIDTIQKNVEIAKNIEDSFRMTPDTETGLLTSEDMMTEDGKLQLNKDIDHNLRTSDKDKQENKIETESCKVDHEKMPEKLSGSETIKEGPMEGDMASSASTIAEKKTKEDEIGKKSPMSMITQTDLPVITEKYLDVTHKDNVADIDTTVTKDFPENNIVFDSMKLLYKKLGNVEKEIINENVDNKDVPVQPIKSIETGDMLIDNQKKLPISTETLENLDTSSNSLMNSRGLLDKQLTNENKKEEKLQADLNTEPSKQIDTIFSARSAEEDLTKTQDGSLDDIETKKIMAIHPEQHLSELKMTNNVDWKTKQAMPPTVNVGEPLEIQEHQDMLHPEMTIENLKIKQAMPPTTNLEESIETQENQAMFHPEMRTENWTIKQAMPPTVNVREPVDAQEHQNMFHPQMRTEDLKNIHKQLMVNPQTRWAEEKDMQLNRQVMKSASGVHPHMLQHSGHLHGHGMQNQHFDMPSSQGFQSRFPEQLMTQEKSVDEDMMQTYYMNQRDNSGMASENHMFRWKPTHEDLRSAYGAPAVPVSGPSSGNALGVFPNAHLGGCGIPLLLSCNPSVVSGSLAKPAAAPYPGPVPVSVPAYRTEDDFTFQMKRDVKNTHENMPSHMYRSPKTNSKTSTVLVAKQ